MSTGPLTAASTPKPPGIVHRYWRAATVVSAILLAVIYLPSPQHRTPRSARMGEVLPPASTVPPGGVTIGGVPCHSGVRQLPFSSYADYCIPAWHGRNGGSTSHGVTSTTITITYREASSSELQLLYSLVPASVVGTNQQAVATMQSYVDLFNRYFDLYGRKVVLVPYSGRSNFLLEDSGLDASEAQVDASTAFGAGAFADISLVDSSELYAADLAADKVIAFSLYVEPSSWYRALAPYEYTTGPDCDKEAAAMASILSTSMAGTPALDVGAGLAGKEGRIGILYPDSGEFPSCARAIVDTLRTQGVHGVHEAGYTVDLGTLQSQAQSIMADMKSAGVTTLVCSSCDPITPQYLARAAVAEGYYPQWFVEPAFALAGSADESFVRLLPPAVTAHALQLGTPALPTSAQEAYQALRLAGGTSEAAPTYPFVYTQLLMLFDALQNAGPHLSPQSFQQGVFAMPPSPVGAEFGGWRSGSEVFDPQQGFLVLHWSPATMSPQDGQPGTWLACAGGRAFDYGQAFLPGISRSSPLRCPPPAAPGTGTRPR